jgi:hypothetical protein
MLESGEAGGIEGAVCLGKQDRLGVYDQPGGTRAGDRVPRYPSHFPEERSLAVFSSDFYARPQIRA